MAEIVAQAEGIQALLAAVQGVRAFSEQPKTVNVTLGTAVVFPLLREISYDEAFGNGSAYAWDVVILAAPQGTDLQRGQRAVDVYLSYDGVQSLRAALYVDKTLGGTVDDCKVTRAYDRGLIDVGETSYWGAKLELLTYD